MAFGITPEGFASKRLADIVQETAEDLRAALGAGIQLDPRTPLGQIKGVLDERLSELWELAEAIYFSEFPGTAEGINLDNVVSITGTTRKSPLPSTIRDGKQLLFGTAGTLIPSGTIFSVDGAPSSTFLTNTNVTLIVGTDEVQTITFSAPPTAGSFSLNFAGQVTSLLLFSATALDVQNALNALSNLSGVTVSGSFAAGFTVTFAADDGKQDQPILTVSASTLANGGPTVITIVETTPGVPQGSVGMTAQNTGPTEAPTGSLTVIDTPVAGLVSTKNIEDAVLGRDLETDAELKNRREDELANPGAATTNAIRSKLLEIEDVIAVVVFENDTSIVDLDGRPPHSVDIVVQGGDDQEIADRIFDVVAAGIETIGDEIESVMDSQGFSHTVKFSRPDEIDIYLEVDVTTTAAFPVDGAAQVEQAFVDYGDRLTIGEDVIIFGTDALINAVNEIPGITDVVIRIGIAPGPTLDDNIVVAPREIAVFDSGNITVNVI